MRTFLIDTDTASDDAVAILMALAAPDVRVAALTTVAGNVGLEQATRNALYTAEVAGSDVPVFKGAAAPLIRRARGRVLVPRPRRLRRSRISRRRDAPQSGRTRSTPWCASPQAEPGLTLVTLGPLTNIALALARDPGFARQYRPLRRHGRRAVLRGQRHAGRRIQHLGRSGSRAARVSLGTADRDGRLARLTRRLGARRGGNRRNSRLDTPKARFAIDCNATRERGLFHADRRARPFARRPHRDGGGARSRDRHELEPAFRRDRMRERSDARHDDRGPSQCRRRRQQ